MMFNWLLIEGAPTLPPIGVGIGFASFGIISMLVVMGSMWFTSHKLQYDPETLVEIVTPNHDNRWPGYPKRLGDDGYDAETKADLGNYK